MDYINNIFGGAADSAKEPGPIVPPVRGESRRRQPALGGRTPYKRAQEKEIPEKESSWLESTAAYLPAQEDISKVYTNIVSSTSQAFEYISSNIPPIMGGAEENPVDKGYETDDSASRRRRDRAESSSSSRNRSKSQSRSTSSLSRNRFDEAPRAHISSSRITDDETSSRSSQSRDPRNRKPVQSKNVSRSSRSGSGSSSREDGAIIPKRNASSAENTSTRSFAEKRSIFSRNLITSITAIPAPVEGEPLTTIDVIVTADNSWTLGATFSDEPVTGPKDNDDGIANAYLNPRSLSANVTGSGPWVVGMLASDFGDQQKLAGLYAAVMLNGEVYTVTGAADTKFTMTNVQPNEGDDWFNPNFDASAWVPAVSPADCPVRDDINAAFSNVTSAKALPAWFESCTSATNIDVWFRVVISLPASAGSEAAANSALPESYSITQAIMEGSATASGTIMVVPTTVPSSAATTASAVPTVTAEIPTESSNLPTAGATTIPEQPIGYTSAPSTASQTSSGSPTEVTGAPTPGETETSNYDDNGDLIPDPTTTSLPVTPGEEPCNYDENGDLIPDPTTTSLPVTPGEEQCNYDDNGDLIPDPNTTSLPVLPEPVSTSEITAYSTPTSPPDFGEILSSARFTSFSILTTLLFTFVML